MSTLFDLIKPLDKMSDQELKEYLYEIRHRKTVEKPAVKARIKKASKKKSNKKISEAEKLLLALDSNQLELLLKGIKK